MKYLILILSSAVLLLQSCDSSRANNADNENEKGNLTSPEPVVQTVKSNEGSIKLTKDAFLKQVWNYNESPQKWDYEGDKPALIDFYADWCGPCKIASPILDELSEEYAGKIYVYKIDTEVEKELASVFGIRGIPAFLYIPMNGKPVMMSGIARSKEATKKMFKDNIAKYLLTNN